MHIHDQHHLVALDNRNSRKISPLYSMAIVSVVGKGYPHNANSRNEGVTQCWSEQQLERTAVPRTNCTTPNLSLLNRHVPGAPAAALPARSAPGAPRARSPGCGSARSAGPGGATCPGPRHYGSARSAGPGGATCPGPRLRLCPLGQPRARHVSGAPAAALPDSAGPRRATCPGSRPRLCPLGRPWGCHVWCERDMRGAAPCGRLKCARRNRI